MRGAMPRAGAAGRSARGARPLDVAERPADPGEVLAVGACHRIDEVVEALSSRVGLERKIARASEEYPVPREAAEEVVLQLGMLARLGNVDRHPAGPRGVELRPAVVPCDVLRRVIAAVAVGERESDVPARRNAALQR